MGMFLNAQKIRDVWDFCACLSCRGWMKSFWGSRVAGCNICVAVHMQVTVWRKQAERPERTTFIVGAIV